MQAPCPITTPSALLLSSLSLFVSLVLLSTCCVSVLIFYSHPFSCFVSCSAPFLFLSLPLCRYISLSLLSPALLLTSSAVLRPLHEANAHSGLAVAACMRSTGGPVKRRQEQEMERETGNARPQGPRRYHHCPPLCVCSGGCIKITSDSPLSSLSPHSLRVCPQLTVLKLTSGLLCVCPLGAGCLKMPLHPSCVCLQLWLAKYPRTLVFVTL